jgi:hypothetical protein
MMSIEALPVQPEGADDGPHGGQSHRVANAVVHVDPLGSSGLGEKSPKWAQDHESVACAVEESVLACSEEITGTSCYWCLDGVWMRVWRCHSDSCDTVLCVVCGVVCGVWCVVWCYQG